ncbi:DNL-type zinc finger protein [Nymphaea thermarum]|nr:DNL-type zinc finger protein [Nymphaea thermarum]
MESLAATVSTIPRSSSIFSPHVTGRGFDAFLRPTLLSDYQHHRSRFPVYFSSRNSSFSGHHGGNQEDPSSPAPDSNAIVPLFRDKVSFSHLSKDEAMGLVLSAAGRGWTTDSGMEGPPSPAAGDQSDSVAQQVSTFPWSLFTRSPRRRMRVAFTCNVCGHRTTRAINPHAYTDGTVFVQCAGCNVFHKLVDNLNLFHEIKGSRYPKFRKEDPMDDIPFRYLGLDDFPGP